MTIEEFLQLSAGKWFSHRTSHDLTLKKSTSGKSEVIIELLAVGHPDVINLCQQHNVDISRASCAVKISWNGTVELDPKKHTGSTVLVTVPDDDRADEGKLLQSIVYDEKTPVVGRYKMGSDDALTLTTESENIWSEERFWFASPNLRMRATTIKRFGDFAQTSFTSEIRMGVTQPPAKASQAAQSM